MSASGSSADPLKIAVVLFLVALSCVFVLDHDLWTPDEPRVGAIAAEVAQGAWIVPTLNGEPFLEKPPLYYWSVALVYRALGTARPEVARVVSGLYGIGALLLTFLLARHVAGIGSAAGAAGAPAAPAATGASATPAISATRIGLLAALCLGLTTQYAFTVHRVVVDTALLFFSTLAAYALVRGVEPSSAQARGRGPSRHSGWLVVGYAGASLAFLAKGPIGLVFAALPLFAWAFARREVRVLWRARPWLALPVFAAVVGPWLLLLERELPGAGLQTLLVDGLLGRVAPGGSHNEPVYYYWSRVPLEALPATLFWIGAVLHRVRSRGSLDPGERLTYDFALVWLGAGLLLLSAPATKRSLYAVPLLPAGALAGGVWLHAWLGRRADDRYARALGGVLAALVAALGIAVPVVAFVIGAPLVVPILAALGVGALGVWILREARADRRTRVLVGTLAGFVVSVTAGDLTLLGVVDAQKSLADPARRISAIVPADRSLYVMRPDETTLGMMPLYASRALVPVASVPELEALLSEKGDIFLLTVQKRGIAPDHPRWPWTRTGSVSHLTHEVLLDHKPGPYARHFRVLHLRSQVAAEGEAMSAGSARAPRL